MGWLVELWCRSTTPKDVLRWLTPHLRRTGFDGRLLTPAAEDVSEVNDSGWGLLHLGNEELFASLSSRTEDCTVFSLTTHRRSSGQHEFLSLWKCLLSDPPTWLAELILQEGTADVYPLLVNSFTRMTPLTLVLESGGTTRRLRPRDATDWKEFGPRLHFLADALLAEHGLSTTEALAASLGADLERIDGGVVLACGWKVP